MTTSTLLGLLAGMTLPRPLSLLVVLFLVGRTKVGQSLAISLLIKALKL